MLLRLSICLILFSQVVYGQEPFSDSKKIHVRKIFNEKATLELPDYFGLGFNGRIVTIGEDPYQSSDVFSDRNRVSNIYCAVYKGRKTVQDARDYMVQMRNQYDDQYHDVLRDELVNNGDSTCFILEYRLNSANYKEEGGSFEYGDGTVSPNYFLIYYILDKGVATSFILDYHGRSSGLEDFRALAYRIIESYKLL